MTDTHWKAWNPGLDNGHLTLRQVHETLPGAPPGDMPWYVRLLENPKSPLALAGAIDLFGHDCIHILLGRGLRQQDEAFVLGFTMGSTDGCRRWETLLFHFCAEFLYRVPYRFSPMDAAVYEFAVRIGKASGAHNLHTVDYKKLLDQPLDAIRANLGIRTDALYAAYAIERLWWPEGQSSARLPQRPARARRVKSKPAAARRASKRK